MPKRLGLWVKRIAAFLAASAIGNYAVTGLSLGVGVVGGLLVTLVSGLSGLSAAALFAGLVLILGSVVLMVAQRLIPSAWLEPRQVGPVESQPAGAARREGWTTP